MQDVDTIPLEKGGIQYSFPKGAPIAVLSRALCFPMVGQHHPCCVALVLSMFEVCVPSSGPRMPDSAGAAPLHLTPHSVHPKSTFEVRRRRCLPSSVAMQPAGMVWCIWGLGARCTLAFLPSHLAAVLLNHPP